MKNQQSSIPSPPLDAMTCSAFLSPSEHGKYWHTLAQERIAEVARLRAELENIANAKPSEWGEMRDQFQAWAQNRARHALATPNLSVSHGEPAHD